MTPLISTPRPKAGESLFGYILRVSESNGYPDPTWIMQHAGMGASEVRSIRPELSKLSKVLLYPEQEFIKISYGNSSERKKLSSCFSVNRHALHKNNLDIKQVRICPECILAQGSIDIFWSLRHAIACPEHGRAALQSCPECKKPLSWYRKGLLICKCGYDLSNERVEKCISPEGKALLRILYNKLHYKALSDEITAKFNFPIQGFERIPLQSLINIIEKVRQRLFFRRIDPEARWSVITVDIIDKTARVFSDWPNCFSDLIENRARKTYRRNNISHDELLRVFKTFINNSMIPKSDVRFIHDAMLIQWAEWPQPQLDVGST